jgi:hypothetical protein
MKPGSGSKLFALWRFGFCGGGLPQTYAFTHCFLFIFNVNHEQMKAGMPPIKPIAINHPATSGSASVPRRAITAKTHPAIAAPIGLNGTSIISATQSNSPTTSAGNMQMRNMEGS